MPCLVLLVREIRWGCLRMSWSKDELTPCKKILPWPALIQWNESADTWTSGMSRSVLISKCISQVSKTPNSGISRQEHQYFCEFHAFQSSHYLPLIHTIVNSNTQTLSTSATRPNLDITASWGCVGTLSYSSTQSTSLVARWHEKLTKIQSGLAYEIFVSLLFQVFSAPLFPLLTRLAKQASRAIGQFCRGRTVHLELAAAVHKFFWVSGSQCKQSADGLDWWLWQYCQ